MLSRIAVLAVLGVGLASAQSPVQQRSAPRGDAEWSKLKAAAPIKKVRVQLRTGETLDCRLDRVEDNSLLLQVNGSQGRQVSRADVLRISRKSRLQGAMWGIAIGAGFGAVMGVAQGASTAGDYYFTRAENTAIGAAVFSVIGAGVGAAVGKRRSIYRYRADEPK
jgi:hypothetical protein